MLDRQGIPDFLLSAMYESPLDFEEALTPLDEFSLITTEKAGTSYEVHRLVQLATQKWLEQRQEIEQWQGKAIELVSKAFPEGSYNNWKTCEMPLPHAEKLSLVLVSDTYCLPQATLLYNMAYHSWRQGRYTLARAWSQGSLSIRKRILTDNDSRIFYSMSIFGVVLRKQGNYDEADTLSRHVLLRREIALGPDHQDTLTSADNLAAAFQLQGKYDEAEMLYQRVIADKVALGANHPDTLTSLDDLASMFMRQGKYDEAETLSRRALAYFEGVLGPEHPETLTSVFCLAYLLQKREKYDDASIFYRRACIGYQKHLGPNHPTTLIYSAHYKAMLQELGSSGEEFQA